MDYYPVTIQKTDKSTFTAEILATSAAHAYTKAMEFYLDAERILVSVPDQNLQDRIKNAVFGLDNPDDAA